MKTIKKTKMYADSPEIVFNQLDDLGITGRHMTNSSIMMMGSKLHLQYLSAKKRGPGTKYRWTGRMMGMKMDFTVQVTKWIAGKEKTWETVGPAKLIIYSWYRMHMRVAPTGNKTLAELSITYEKPKGFFYKILSYFFAAWYGAWCLANMFNDPGKSLNQAVINSKNSRSKYSN